MHLLVLVGLVGVEDGVVDGFGEVPEHSLFGAVVGELAHDVLIFPDLVAHSVGVVDEVAVGEVVGDEEFVEPGDDLGEKFFFRIAGLGRSETFAGVQSEFP